MTSSSELSTTVQLGGFDLVLTGRNILVGDGEPTVLTARERQVLDALLERPGVVCSKDALLRSIWGRSESDTHVVEVTVGRLRQRLGAAGGGIETVIRRGYRISPTRASDASVLGGPRVHRDARGDAGVE